MLNNTRLFKNNTITTGKYRIIFFEIMFLFKIKFNVFLILRGNILKLRKNKILKYLLWL